MTLSYNGTRQGGKTVDRTRLSDLRIGVLCNFQLGTNDLTALQSAAETGFAVEDLVRLLYESYTIRLVDVYQTICRKDAPSFNGQVNILTQFEYLKIFLVPTPYVLCW